jgi:predicted phage terminase large subunit-like protein
MDDIFYNSEETEQDAIVTAGQENFITYSQLVMDDYDPGDFHLTMGHALEQVAEGKIKRLMIFAPPRHGKSRTVTELFPAYYIGKYELIHNHTTGVIVVGYAEEKAKDFGKNTLGFMKSDAHREIFPHSLIDKSTDSKTRFSTVGGSNYYAVGVGGQLTGRGATLIIIDDPYKNLEEAKSDVYQKKLEGFWTSTLRSRLENDGAIILIYTRWSDGDIADFLLEQEEEESTGEEDDPYKWRILDFSALIETEEQKRKDPLERDFGDPLWPERISKKNLLQIKKEVGPKVWSALYQQEPFISDGDIFKRDWFQFYDPEEHARLGIVPDQKAMSWDMSFSGKKSSDPVVGLAGYRIGSNLYLTDRTTGRWNYAEAKKAFLAFCIKHPGYLEKWIENKANGPAIISDLKNVIPGLIPVNPEALGNVSSKQGRWEAAAAAVESGNVYLPYNAWWTNEFLNKVCKVPNAKHDDDADALSQFIIMSIGYQNLDAMLKYFESMGRKLGVGEDKMQEEFERQMEAEMKLEAQEQARLLELMKQEKDPEINEFFGMV